MSGRVPKRISKPVTLSHLFCSFVSSPLKTIRSKVPVNSPRRSEPTMKWDRVRFWFQAGWNPLSRGPGSGRSENADSGLAF